MRILQNQNILQRQSDNYIRGELSNVSMVVQSPQLLVDWYDIDPDLSPTMVGFKNVEDYIHPSSHVVYHKIEELPMAGIDNLVSQAQFDEEVGFDEDFQSSGIIFPNTIVPKPYSCFRIRNSEVLALYVVTNVSPVTVRSNPFVEVQFRLFTRNPEIIKQLERQVKDTYITTVTAVGLDKSLVIKKESYYSIAEHIEQYMQILDMYKLLFWDQQRAAFIYDGFYDEKLNARICYADLVLWKIMFHEGIIIYDDLVTYAANNMNYKVTRLYTSSPDPYVDDYTMKTSILWRIYAQDHKHRIDEFKFPQSYEPDPRIGKFTGKNLYYFERYGDQCDCNLMCTNCPTWDEEFVERIKNNDPYNPDVTAYANLYTNGSLNNNSCCTVITDSEGNPVGPGSIFNPHLRNAIINYYNDMPIDWDNIELVSERTCENYFLIPILLGAYKKYIKNLQK